MSKPTDESFQAWMDTEYSKGLTGGEALRSAFDSGAKWQREQPCPFCQPQAVVVSPEEKRTERLTENEV